MATHVGHFLQDQNLNVHLDAPVGGKGNVSKAQKKGVLSGRKALNDISNSGKPPALQPSRKHNSINAVSIGEDLGVSKSKISVGGKVIGCKATEKAQVGGRKALGDLTNSGKPSAHQLSKGSQAKKLITVPEEHNLPSSIAEERFLHDHQKCIKAQRKGVDMDYFLKTVGLNDDFSMQLASPRALSPLSRNSKPVSPLKHMMLEEIPELMMEDFHQPPQRREFDLFGEHNMAVCGSPPNSPKLDMHWKDYNFSDFILVESP